MTQKERSERVQIRKFGLFRKLRADASSYIQYYRKGHHVTSGRGLAFWFIPDNASVTEVPIDDRELPFIFQGQSADYQDIALQGSLVWRVSDPGQLAERIDFSIDLGNGQHTGQPLEQVNNVLVTLAQQFAIRVMKAQGVRELLEGGVAPFRHAIADGFAADGTLEGLGLELVNAAITDLAPSSELSRALQTPTFEHLQQAADEASFSRRALAVEKERAIAENELNNRIELAARQHDLIAREDANGRAEAEANAARMTIEAEAEAGRILKVEQAQADMEKARMDVYTDLAPNILLALAARDLAQSLKTIDSVTITPDMMRGLLGQVKEVFGEQTARTRDPAG
jgi:regulator of protease activity HflC (stomatin/prohibitin superfamily)